MAVDTFQITPLHPAGYQIQIPGGRRICLTPDQAIIIYPKQPYPKPYRNVQAAQKEQICNGNFFDRIWKIKIKHEDSLLMEYEQGFSGVYHQKRNLPIRVRPGDTLKNSTIINTSVLSRFRNQRPCIN